jgi:DnaJ-domain-containing protein 1
MLFFVMRVKSTIFSQIFSFTNYFLDFLKIMASASSGDNYEKSKSNNNMRSGFLGKTGSDETPLDKTYYNILNVSPTASATEIKRAYYAFSLQYHPDRTQNLDDFTRREYAERFKFVSQAYCKIIIKRKIFL